MVIILACKIAAWAQPSLIFPPASPGVGESFCVEVKVKDFTDILSMEFSLQWDSSIIQFERVEGFNLPSFSATNFNTSLTPNGKISIDWEIAACSPTANGVTRPDGTIIFRLCFKALAQYGGTSEIILSDDPIPIRVTRVNACPNNIGMFSKNGLVSIGVRPLILIASQETANEGDLVCVDFSVNGFDDLTSMQYSMKWDPAVLKFDDVVVLDKLTNLVESNFGTPDQPNVGEGRLTLSWTFVEPSDPGITLPDSTVIYQVCFRVIGKCATSSVIEFVDSPTPFEFTNTVVAGYEIKVLQEVGKVQVNKCDPAGLKIFADCGAPVNPNEEICVKISTADFRNIREMEYNLEWNENVLRFVGVKNFNGQVVGLDLADFNVGNVSNGVLGLDWSTVNSNGASLPNGAGSLFEVCFKVIGVDGGSPITFTGSPPRVATFNNPNFGLNPTNCAVEIIEPSGVVMNLKSVDAPLGDTACVDISVTNFNQIVNYQFSLAWETNHMSFVGINNINLPGASETDFNFIGVDGGALSFSYTPSSAQTIVDNTVIFKACFQTTGAPQDCDNLEVVNQPVVTKAVNTTSNNNDIGVVSQPGEVCILFPEGFLIDIGEVTADTGIIACVPIKVVSFDNITAAQIPFSWEPSALDFVSIQNTGALSSLSNASFDTTSANVGLLKLNWTNPSPVTVPDSTIIFNVCFNLVGIPDSCYDVRVGEPKPLVTTANGSGSLLSNPGEICIRPKLTVADTIIKAVSCPGTNDGEITLAVNGGRGPLGITWETVPPRFGPTARNLPPGKVAVTIFDNSSPALILRDTFDIPTNPNLPFADAGLDKDFSCAPPIVPLQGQGSAGAQYTYLWRTIDGQLTPDTNRLAVSALAPGTYVLNVKNSETGCTAADTVKIIPIDFPKADAGEQANFSCSQTTFPLDGSASSTGANFSYRWVGSAGGTVVAGRDTLQVSQAATPGTFVLSVTNKTSGCVDRDTFLLRSTQEFPNANAGQDMELSCGQTPMAELFSQSVNNDSVAYQWLSLTGEVLSQDVRYQATAIGEYLLRVTNPNNNCSAIDTVQVNVSTKTPDIKIDSSQQLTCIADTVTLTAVVTNATNYIIQWTASNGGQFVPGTDTTLTPQVAKPGTYQLVVRDTASQCSALDTVAVKTNINPPTAKIDKTNSPSLTCQSNAVQLNGTGSSTGANFKYAWRLDSTVVARDTLRPSVSNPGKYILEVTDTANGCTAIDSIQVAADTSLVRITLPLEELKLSCTDSVKTITATVQPANPNYNIVWTPSNGGQILTGQGTLTIRANVAGTYQLKVTNPTNGCFSSNEAVIREDKVFPAAKAGENAAITCTTTTVPLNGAGSSVGADFTYRWNALAGGQAPSPNNALQVSVTRPGSYELVVTNSANRCVARDTVVVAKNDSIPRISFGTPEQLTCTDSLATVNASATTPNANVTAQWNGLDSGVPQLTNNPLIINVNQGGRYELLITNNDNGCVARDTVEVLKSADVPTAKIDSTRLLTCLTNTTPLSAAGSTVIGAFTTQWIALDGGSVQVSPNNPLQATATGAGKYQLTITSTATGCKATTETVVKKDPNEPVASAMAAKPSIGCGENTMLNSAGSSSGTGISYRWSVVSGTGAVTNPTAQSVQVDKAGTYQLVVTNAQNGCTDTATVAITFNVQFEKANAGADKAVCEPTATLASNLPAGTTGQWRSLSNATIANPAQVATSVANLAAGNNRFVWALSATGCGEYSADTTSIKLESKPVAADDAFTLKSGETQGTIVVTGNDNLNNVANFSVSIAQNPTVGGIAGVGADGKVAYLVKPGAFGQDEFSYALCSTNCPSYCDTAFVQINIEEDPNFEAPPRVNAITPNGDGLNDNLMFDELLINAEQYPDNELIVFNRWGDIVYTARPYANDWNGTNETNQDLPEGTYYYILRLDISEGIIIRGDVTIVR